MPIDEKALEAATSFIWKDEYGSLRETWKEEHRAMFEAYEAAKEQPTCKENLQVADQPVGLSALEADLDRYEVECIKYGADDYAVSTDKLQAARKVVLKHFSQPERESGSRWISVKDELPRQYVDVLVFCSGYAQQPKIARITDIKQYKRTGEYFNGKAVEDYDGFRMDWSVDDVTYWMALPATTHIEGDKS